MVFFSAVVVGLLDKLGSWCVRLMMMLWVWFIIVLICAIMVVMLIVFLDLC